MNPFSVKTAGQLEFLRMPMSLVVQLQVQYLHVGTERLPVILRAIASSVKYEAHFLEASEAFLETNTLKPLAVPQEPLPAALLWIETSSTFFAP